MNAKISTDRVIALVAGLILGLVLGGLFSYRHPAVRKAHDAANADASAQRPSRADETERTSDDYKDAQWLMTDFIAIEEDEADGLITEVQNVEVTEHACHLFGGGHLVVRFAAGQPALNRVHVIFRGGPFVVEARAEGEWVKLIDTPWASWSNIGIPIPCALADSAKTFGALYIRIRMQGETAEADVIKMRLWTL